MRNLLTILQHGVATGLLLPGLVLAQTGGVRGQGSGVSEAVVPVAALASGSPSSAGPQAVPMPCDLATPQDFGNLMTSTTQESVLLDEKDCDPTRLKKRWSCKRDCCPSLPKGSMPMPAGHYLRLWNEAMATRAEADDFVIYKHEWYMGGVVPGPYGVYHLG